MGNPTNSTACIVHSALMIFSLIVLSSQANAAELAGAEIGPDGHAYQLVDCSTAEHSSNLDLCPGIGPITWTQAAQNSAGLSYRELTVCHLATPSTSNVNEFLKNFAGFSAACKLTTISGLELCAWIGARDVTPGEGNGPYQLIDDANNNIPCTSGLCDPVVQPGVDTTLTLEDWCTVESGCTPYAWANEPNGNNEEFVGYLQWDGGGIGWHDCEDDCFQQNGPTSYFVECEAPPPACPESPGCYCAGKHGIRKVACDTDAPWSDTDWKNKCRARWHFRETPTIIMEQPSDDECQNP